MIKLRISTLKNKSIHKDCTYCNILKYDIPRVIEFYVIFSSMHEVYDKNKFTE